MAGETRILDLSDRSIKRELMAHIGGLQGPHEVSIKKRFRGRTLPQNSYYWACVVPALVDGLREQWGEDNGSEEAHEMLKDRFLKVEVRRTDEHGEIKSVSYVRSTTKLDTVEFTDYIEKCRDFIADWFGIIIPDPGERGGVL